jgi:hypothetical protein
MMTYVNCFDGSRNEKASVELIKELNYIKKSSKASLKFHS